MIRVLKIEYNRLESSGFSQAPTCNGVIPVNLKKMTLIILLWF